MINVIVFYLLTSLVTYACADIVYPKTYGKQQLVTTLHCQDNETQHFKYSSTTNLLGNVGDDILLTADVTIHCLGNDQGGKYESEVLKYLVEVSNIKIKKKENSAAFTEIDKIFEKIFGFQKHKRGPIFTKASSSFSDVEDDSNEESDVEEEDIPESTAKELGSMYSVPFQFLQLANGSIPEIRFAENEIQDGSIRNFKRHLVDVFQTHLNFEDKQKDVLETSVTGEHTSSYNVRISEDEILTNHINKEQKDLTVKVEKLVTGGRFHKLASTGILDDRENVELFLQQNQIFKGGKLSESSGKSSATLFPGIKSSRNTHRSKEEGIDQSPLIETRSTFKLKLHQNRPRSIEESARIKLHENAAFQPAGRMAEKQGVVKRKNLRNLRDSFGDVSTFFQNLFNNPEKGNDYEDKVQMLSEIIQTEKVSKLATEPNSASYVLKNALTEDMWILLCKSNFPICKDFLQLLAVTGGSKAESVLLIMLSERSNLTPFQKYLVAGIIPELSNPSSTFLDLLVDLISDKDQDPEVVGSVYLGSGTLGAKGDRKMKYKISLLFTKLLRRHKTKCENDENLIDILEAIGNLQSKHTVSAVLEVSTYCSQSSSIQIACLHALRHYFNEPIVKTWMQNVIVTGDCEVISAMAGALADAIQEQQNIGDTTSWPIHGFNQVDENLKLLLPICAAEDIITYFSRKKDAKADEIVKSYNLTEDDLWNFGGNIRQKRETSNNFTYQDIIEELGGLSEGNLTQLLKDLKLINSADDDDAFDSLDETHPSGNITDLLDALDTTKNYDEKKVKFNFKILGRMLKLIVRELPNIVNEFKNKKCDEWDGDGEAMAGDRNEKFDKKKSCLLYKKLQTNIIKAKVYAGMFAGVKGTVQNPKYKVFTKLAFTIQIVQRPYEISSLYFYHNTGYTKAYIRVLGITIRKFTKEAFEPTYLSTPTRYLHIPLFMYTVGAADMSLGVYFKGNMALEMKSPKAHVYIIEPKTSLRIGPEIKGTVLFVKAAVSVGVNLNYKFQMRFTPSPNMCVRITHGWNTVTLDTHIKTELFQGGSRKSESRDTWKPKFLTWPIIPAATLPLLKNKCLFKNNSNT